MNDRLEIIVAANRPEGVNSECRGDTTETIRCVISLGNMCLVLISVMYVFDAKNLFKKCMTPLFTGVRYLHLCSGRPLKFVPKTCSYIPA